jgi:hypothetical protein
MYTGTVLKKQQDERAGRNLHPFSLHSSSADVVCGTNDEDEGMVTFETLL